MRGGCCGLLRARKPLPELGVRVTAKKELKKEGQSIGLRRSFLNLFSRLLKVLSLHPPGVTPLPCVCTESWLARRSVCADQRFFSVVSPRCSCARRLLVQSLRTNIT